MHSGNVCLQVFAERNKIAENTKGKIRRKCPRRKPTVNLEEETAKTQ